MIHAAAVAHGPEQLTLEPLEQLPGADDWRTETVAEILGPWAAPRAPVGDSGPERRANRRAGGLDASGAAPAAGAARQEAGR